MTGVQNSKVTEGAYYTAMRWTIPPTPGVLAPLLLRNEGPIEGEADKADRAQHRSIASVETSKRPRRSYARQDQGRRTRRPYRLRKQLPEPVFGQIKQARGFRQFLLRGFEKVCAEWALVCTPQSSQAR